MIEKVLVVDDDSTILRFIADILRRQGKDLTLATNGSEALEILESEHFDLVITDMKMPVKGGLDILKYVKAHHPSLLVIIATAHGSIDSAVEAMKLGAFHYLIKPFSPDALESILEKAEEHVRLHLEHRFYKEDGKQSPMIAQSQSMKKIVQDLEKIAKSNASIFITGESGTGKEVIASCIHKLSTRSQSPFVKVNCAAIPEALLESEFFGHERGSFTGAHTRKIGRFELANNGTILLDEVTEIPLALQPKLLRVIQEQECERVGGTKMIKLNLRFLATSNRNMQEAIATKVFREDLFYRLNVVPIHLPPLRERQDDIIALANHFLQKFCVENHKAMKQFTASAEKKLLQYPWPGNVRELANVIERTVVLENAQTIDAEHIRLETKVITISDGSLHDVEKKHILDILEANHKNRTKTAAVLGISVRTLRNKLRLFGISL